MIDQRAEKDESTFYRQTNANDGVLLVEGKEEPPMAPIITQDDLREYKELLKAKDLILAEIAKREDAMKAHAEEHGDIEGYGVRAYKGVSKSYDRLGAVEKALAVNPEILEIVLAHTKASKSTAKTNWVNVIRDAGIDMKPFTKETAVYKISVAKE